MRVSRVKIKEAMEKIGIKNQNELAECLGITKNQLSVILSDRYTPFKTQFIHICEVLNVKAEELLEKYYLQKIDEKVEKSKNEVTALELFAGAGGLALGLEQSGIHTLAQIEINKFCCDTLRKNRPNWNVLNLDVSEVDFKKYKGKIDIVTGGFPCQAFSYAGKKMGFEDVRGTLFYEFARCVKEVEPLIFMAENVRGLISHDNGRTLSTIIKILEELGYSVKYKVLNAVHFGVPQKRERIIIIGTKKDVDFDYPERAEKVSTIKEALKNVPRSEGQSYSANKKAILEMVPPGGCWRQLPLEIQKSYMGKSFTSGGGRTGMARRISWDEPCLTLTCSPSQKQTERCHPDETRPFTVREYARIQTFPDDWEFSGGIGEKYKQIGNAVPVYLAKQLGLQLRKSILKYREKHELMHDVKDLGFEYQRQVVQ